MILLILIIVSFWTTPVWATIAVVQAVSVGTFGFSTATTSDITSTTGSLFICDAGHYDDSFGAGFFSSITDSKSNTYIDSVSEIQSSSGSHVRGRQQYAANGTGGATHNFTLTGTDSNMFLSLACKEVSDALTASVLDKTASKQDNSGTTGLTSTSTALTSQANELLAGGAVLPTNVGSPTGFTVSGSFTEDEEVTGESGVAIGLVSASRVVSASSTYAFTFDIDNSMSGVIAWISTWKEDIGAPAPTVRRRVMILP